MNRRALICGLAALPVAAGFASAQGTGWTRHVNDRFGTRIDYPADIFTPDPPPTNNDGRTFRDAGGRAMFRIWGMYNVLDQTIDGMRAEDAAKAAEVTYRTGGDDWYVLSGHTAEGRIFYSRRLLRDGVIHALEVEYDRADAAWMDPIVARMSKSFGAV